MDISRKGMLGFLVSMTGGDLIMQFVSNSQILIIKIKNNKIEVVIKYQVMAKIWFF